MTGTIDLIVKFNERLGEFTKRMNRWLMVWCIVFFAVLFGLSKVADDHWALGAAFLIWLFSSLIQFWVFSRWIELRLCRELGLICPNCHQPVIDAFNRRSRKGILAERFDRHNQQPEPLECQWCRASLFGLGSSWFSEEGIIGRN